MTYEQAMKIVPASLEEALEQTFWKKAGDLCMGACRHETWTAVANAAREFMASPMEPSALDDRIRKIVCEEMSRTQAATAQATTETEKPASDDVARSRISDEIVEALKPFAAYAPKLAAVDVDRILLIHVTTGNPKVVRVRDIRKLAALYEKFTAERLSGSGHQEVLGA